MAFVVQDRVKETTTTTGTGTVTLSGAVVGYQSFSVIGNGNTTYYTITDGVDWEVGLGTYTSSGTTLSRDTVLSSSNSGSKVNWGAGAKDVFVTYPAEKSVVSDSPTISNPNITTGLLLTGAAGTSGQALLSSGSGSAPVWGDVSAAVAYPQNSQSADYTLVLSDAGKQIFHPASDTAARTYTIPNNSSVAFPIGTVVVFAVDVNAYSVAVKVDGGTITSASGKPGTITVSSGMAVQVVKVGTNTWLSSATRTTLTYSIAVGSNSTPYITAYPWAYASGFGTKYTNPTSLPGGTVYGVSFTFDGTAIAMGFYGPGPGVIAYKWSPAGFGTKYTDPASSPGGYGQTAVFSPAGDAVAVGVTSPGVSPYIYAYPWTYATGFGTKYSNPATLPGGVAGVAFSPAGNAIAVSNVSSPYVNVYPWSSASGFGTKYSDPATLPTGQGNDVAFSPAGDALAVAHNTSPYVTVYPWTYASGFGAKYTDPATLPASNGLAVCFSPASDALAVGHVNSPYVTVYPWSASGFGTKYSDPATLPTGNGFGVDFSLTGDALAVAHLNSPYVTAYPWSSSGFGTKYTNPTTLPPSNSFGIKFGLSD